MLWGHWVFYKTPIFMILPYFTNYFSVETVPEIIYSCISWSTVIFSNAAVMRVILSLPSAADFPLVLDLLWDIWTSYHSTVADYVQYHYLIFFLHCSSFYRYSTAHSCCWIFVMFEHDTMFFLLSPQKLLYQDHFWEKCFAKSKTRCSNKLLPPLSFFPPPHSILPPA